MSLPLIGVHMTFEEAARETLRYLRENVPMDFWSVTRVENGRQTFLYLDENDVGIVEGASVPWEASFCIHMVSGVAPAVAPDISVVPQYAATAEGLGLPVTGYAGTLSGRPTGGCSVPSAASASTPTPPSTSASSRPVRSCSCSVRC